MFRFVAGLALAIPLVASAAEPQDFAAFVASLHRGGTADLPDGRVDETALTAARAHLLAMYDGIVVRQTILQDGRTMDCIRYDQQPAIRLGTITRIAEPPALPPRVLLHAPPADEGAAEPATPACAAGTFPMQRLTLARILRAGSLRGYFRKGPQNAGQAHLPPADPRNADGHAYAYAYQYVTNWGGTTGESLYNPVVDSSAGEAFSLEQSWYFSGFGAAEQTAEVGWQVFPALYGTTGSVLFSYFTADDYQTTGCYNYDCGAFVQNPHSEYSLGISYKKYSVVGGRQITLRLGYYFHDGNWWLAAGNDWIGYYPSSVYAGGPMANHATVIEYGTESYGTAVWPPEGSGQFASAGPLKVAYQRNITWLDSAHVAHTPSLNILQPSITCYTATTPAIMPGRFAYGFFLGGPGGTGC